MAALPPSITASLPKISILLVPYLERAGKEEAKAAQGTETSTAEKPGPQRKKAAARPGSDYVSIERPPDGRTSTFTQLKLGEETVLAFALKGQEVAEYHYRFYHQLATLLSEQFTEQIETRYSKLLREELLADVHGEVDEPSWRLKQSLRRSQGTRGGKAFREYARQSFADTLTLYLHGLCCDIDVETGPRQLPSRYLRKRLILIEEMFPPGQGYVLFPEQLEA